MIVIKTNKGLEIEARESSTILDNAMKAGVVFEHSCKNGRCGVCAVQLLNGEVTELHTQIALNNAEKENNMVLTCCCAPKTSITIDAKDLSVLHDYPCKIIPVRINSIQALSPDVVEVTFRHPQSERFKFLSGQFIEVIRQGERRSYSIASTANEHLISILVKKVERGVFSRYWFNDAKVNDLLRIEGPSGTFFLREPNKPLIFLATGTGIAPIKSMLNALDQDQGYSQKEKIWLIWGNRVAPDIVWNPEFKRIKVNFIPVLSRPDYHWSGYTGYVQEVALAKIDDKTGADVYACGSSNMIESAKVSFLNNGLQIGNFYSETFVESNLT